MDPQGQLVIQSYHNYPTIIECQHIIIHLRTSSIAILVYLSTLGQTWKTRSFYLTDSSVLNKYVLLISELVRIFWSKSGVDIQRGDACILQAGTNPAIAKFLEKSKVYISFKARYIIFGRNLNRAE